MPLDLSKVPGVRMQSADELSAPPTFLFYGKGKTGKTTLACSAAAVPELSPVAVVDFEGSTESVAGLYDVDVYRVTNWTQAAGVLDALINQSHDYRTVVLDPVNALQTMLKDELIRRQAQTQPNAKSNNSMGDRSLLQSDWDVIWTRMRKILETYHAAPFTTILTAHADTVQDDLGRTMMEPLMQGNKTKNEVTRVPSVVGYVQMSQDSEGNVFPVVRFAGSKGIIAGDRFRKLGVGLENPTMQTIYDKIYKNESEN